MIFNALLASIALAQLQVGPQQCASSGKFSRIPGRVSLNCPGICQSPILSVHFSPCPGANLTDAEVVLSGFQFQGGQRSTLEFRLGTVVLSKTPAVDGGIDVVFRIDSRWTYSTLALNEYYLWVDIEAIAAANVAGARIIRGKAKCGANGNSCLMGTSIPVVDPGAVAMPMALKMFRFATSRTTSGVDISKLSISNSQTQSASHVDIDTMCAWDSYVSTKTTDCATDYAGFVGDPIQLKKVGELAIGLPSLTGSGQVGLTAAVPIVSGIPRLLNCGLRGFSLEAAVSVSNKLWQLWSGVSAQTCDVNLSNSIFSATGWTAWGNSPPPPLIPNTPVYYYQSSVYSHTWELSPSVAY